ncbi:RDD family protein [Streptomyces sp. NBC_01591]|uniref:RDD family protein n=1 Tax=Streptomyces sp. NBC_01591 TaxID=2975888 RepID=UPI002DD820B5|nr:RDD family protein [Streptomyces sp. NBC_01591]WSD68710.1 RDD family protein [Streptomyces sp. NBC_01591]
MSAPTPAPGDESPREGYYPDPSIPGYVRYWNGASWVPGTSRPAPQQGESMPAAPSGADPSAPAAEPQPLPQSQPQSSVPAPVDETGPVFLDEEPHAGNRPEPATAWQADASRQTGFGERDRRVSWGGTGRPGEQGDPGRPSGPESGAGSEPGHDPRTPAGPVPADRAPADPRRPAAAPVPSSSADAAGGALPVARDAGGQAPENTVAIRVGRQGRPGGSGTGSGGGTDAGAGDAGRPPADGTVTIRAVGQGGRPPAHRTTEPAATEGTMAIRAIAPGTGAPAPAPTPAQAPDPTPAQNPAPAPAQNPAPAPAQNRTPAPAPVQNPAPWAQLPAQQPQPQQPQPQLPAQQHQQPQPQLPAQQQPQPQQPQPQLPAQQQHQPQQPQPQLPAQQQHQPQLPAQQHQPQPQLQPQQPRPQFGAQGAQPDQPVVPWKPPVDDPFQRLAQAQAAARPAGLGKRFAARLIDSVVLLALVGAIGFPLVSQALDHIDEKISAAKLSGETVTVWLVDSTTAGLFGAVLGAFLVLGVLLEALPTAKWGRTLGKKICGLEVRDIESHDAPAFGAALRRWLVYGVLGVLVIGVVNVLWCLIDRPWRQCWHDKAAHTFVAD